MIPILPSLDPLSDPAVRSFILRLRKGGQSVSDDQGGIEVKEIVAEIIRKVAQEGDEGLISLEARLDGVSLSTDSLRVPLARIEEAHQAAPPEFMALIRRVIPNIREYQESILARPAPPLIRGSRQLSLRLLPLERAAVYVPGGKAFYPSTVLMTVIPAQVAGVREIAMTSPPSSQGDIHPMVLALAGELGITEIYRLGGAVAIAALALGTSQVRAADKIVGPGNAFVAEAKRQLFGTVGIDLIAGPSEVLIIADDSARPEWLAADMLAQSEHDPGSSVLITPSADLAKRVQEALMKQVVSLERSEAARSSLESSSAILVVSTLAEAASLANEIASEHLQIITREDDAVLAQIRNAGAIFVGSHTPVPVGDYWAGPSHVLPTGGTARFSGPLSCNDFLKSCSVMRYSSQALMEDAADIAAFARFEGLTGHARSVELRAEE